MKKNFLYLFCGLINLQLSEIALASDRTGKENTVLTNQPSLSTSQLELKVSSPLKVIVAKTYTPLDIQSFDLLKVTKEFPEFQKELADFNQEATSSTDVTIPAFTDFSYHDGSSLCLMTTTQTNHLVALSSHFNSDQGEKIAPYAEQRMVKQFMDGFNKLIWTSSLSIPNIKDCIDLFDPAVVSKASLTSLLEIYIANLGILTEIAEQNDVFQKELDKTTDKKTRELITADILKNYARLVTNRIFTSFLAQDKKRVLKAHLGVYDLIRKWYFVTQTCITTASFAGNQEKGKAFFDSQVKPKLELLFLNKHNACGNITMFSHIDDYSALNMIKFSLGDGLQPFTIVLAGNKIKEGLLLLESKKEEAQKTAPQTKAVKKKKDDDDYCTIS